MTETGANRSERDTGLRLARAVLGFYVVVVGVIVLVPFSFRLPDAFRWESVMDVPDMLANVLLFLPFGFLYRVSRRRRASALQVLLVGAGVSLGIECIQMLEPERYPSLLDVAANGVGAWLGALACAAAERRLEASALVGRLSLELPLMGLVYLVVPLLWVGSLSHGDSLFRLWMLSLPIVFGATLLGIVQRHHFGPGGAFTTRGMALAAAGGAALGTFPLLSRSPVAVLLLAMLAAAIVARHAMEGMAVPVGGDRRFEGPALRAGSPILAAYLAACAIAPLTEPANALAVAGAASEHVRTVEILRLLNVAAAFTVLGYAVAELRGRLQQSLAATWGHLLLWTAPPALATLFVGSLATRDAPWNVANTSLWLLLTLGGAAYGGWLYYLQRDHVRALLSRRVAAPAGAWDGLGAHDATGAHAASPVPVGISAPVA